MQIRISRSRSGVPRIASHYLCSFTVETSPFASAKSVHSIQFRRFERIIIIATHHSSNNSAAWCLGRTLGVNKLHTTNTTTPIRWNSNFDCSAYTAEKYKLYQPQRTLMLLDWSNNAVLAQCNSHNSIHFVHSGLRYCLHWTSKKVRGVVCPRSKKRKEGTVCGKVLCKNTLGLTEMQLM